MAANGLRPVAEIQFADYIYPAYDQIASEAARLRYRSNGDFTAPITIRTPVGGGIYGGQTHSQSPEALFTHIAGLKTIIPSNPYDAKGMLIAAIEDNDPVLFLEPKRLYRQFLPMVRCYGSRKGSRRIWVCKLIFLICVRFFRWILMQSRPQLKKQAAALFYMSR